MIKLNATKRSKEDKLAVLRQQGLIPAVVYGAGIENTIISVPSASFIKVFKEAGESNTIVLDIAGKNIDVLIHDTHKDPVKSHVVHIDFLAIDMKKVITVPIQLEFIGVSPAEKAGLGGLVKVLHEVEVEALPKDLPQKIEVNIESLLTLEDQIHVSDLKLPTGVKMITEDDEVVALVASQKEEVESVPVDLSAIEVEKKGKQEDGEATSETDSKTESE